MALSPPVVVPPQAASVAASISTASPSVALTPPSPSLFVRDSVSVASLSGPPTGPAAPTFSFAVPPDQPVRAGPRFERGGGRGRGYVGRIPDGGRGAGRSGLPPGIGSGGGRFSEWGSPYAPSTASAWGPLHNAWGPPGAAWDGNGGASGWTDRPHPHVGFSFSRAPALHPDASGPLPVPPVSHTGGRAEAPGVRRGGSPPGSTCGGGSGGAEGAPHTSRRVLAKEKSQGPKRQHRGKEPEEPRGSEQGDAEDPQATGVVSPTRRPVTARQFMGEHGHPDMASQRRRAEDYVYAAVNQEYAAEPVALIDIGGGSGGFLRAARRLREHGHAGIARIHVLAPLVHPADAIRHRSIPKVDEVEASGGATSWSVAAPVPMTGCSHKMSNCDCESPVGFADEEVCRRIFMSTHSFYYLTNEDFAQFRPGDVLYTITHPFEGNSGTIGGTPDKPEYYWSRSRGLIKMVPRSVDGTVYVHPDPTSFLRRGWFSWMSPHGVCYAVGCVKTAYDGGQTVVHEFVVTNTPPSGLDEHPARVIPRALMSEADRVVGSLGVLSSKSHADLCSDLGRAVARVVRAQNVNTDDAWEAVSRAFVQKRSTENSIRETVGDDAVGRLVEQHRDAEELEGLSTLQFFFAALVVAAALAMRYRNVSFFLLILVLLLGFWWACFRTSWRVVVTLWRMARDRGVISMVMRVFPFTITNAFRLATAIVTGRWLTWASSFGLTAMADRARSTPVASPPGLAAVALEHMGLSLVPPVGD